MMLAAALPAAAQEAPIDGVVSLIVDNDVFNGSDGNYTSGIELVVVPRNAPAPEWAVRLARSLPWFPDGGRIRHGYIVGQTMFTPQDLALADPPRDDRPYAGLLYGAIGIGAEDAAGSDQLVLSLGVVGPASLAERSQKFIHRITGSVDPQGWDTQLRNEPALGLSYQRRWRDVASGRFLGLEYDLVPHAGATLGNVYTYANAGASVRLGKRLSSDLGPLRIRPSPPGSGSFIPSEVFSWYLHFGVDGRAVARNIFLDGNTFRDSRSVDKKVLVGDLQWGLELTWQGIRVCYTHVRRSREFESQDESASFGAISVSAAIPFR